MGNRWSRMNKGRKRAFAIALATAVASTTLNVGSIAANAGTSARGRVIVAFEELPEEIAEQTLPIGSRKSDIDFPEELDVLLYSDDPDADDRIRPRERATEEATEEATEATDESVERPTEQQGSDGTTDGGAATDEGTSTDAAGGSDAGSGSTDAGSGTTDQGSSTDTGSGSESTTDTGSRYIPMHRRRSWLT